MKSLNQIKSIYNVCFILCILSISTLQANVNPKEITYYKFNSKMMDWRTGYPELQIKFTYVEEEDFVNIYYHSGRCLVALLLNKENREKLLEYINKYEEWQKIAIEKKVTLKRKMGSIKSEIFFKYREYWHEGSPIIEKIYFFSLNNKRHQFLIQPITTVAKYYQSFSVEPDILYFNLQDVLTLKKALQKEFIQTQVKKRMEELRSIEAMEDEFK